MLLATVAACSQSGQPVETGIEIPDPTGTSTGLVWTRMSGKEPPMKTEFSMVYDATHQKIIAFGGRDANFNNVQETWATISKPTLGPIGILLLALHGARFTVWFLIRPETPLLCSGGRFRDCLQ